MKKRLKKEPIEYAKTAFDSLRACQYRWNKNLTTSIERSISRLFYDQVFSSGADKSGFSTILKGQWWEHDMLDDHYMAPQSVTKFIMDTEFLLDDFDKFLDCFMMCRKTHYVAKIQNEELKNLTKKTLVLTRDRYKHLGYNLYGNGTIFRNPELQVPSYYTDWEKGFQENNFRPTITDNKIGTLENFL
tara:strand:+ start:91 stop:654 length:564 start_codon:yes stop_codon:yes gene_type:complete